MAKVGEGDARWIVADRDDGRNCNDWHWTEKNLSDWAHGTIKSELQDKEVFRGPGLVLQSQDMESVSGDATVMNRKKKIICAFDLTFELKWEGKLLDDGGESIYTCKGRFKCPDLDDSTDPDDCQVDVVCSESDSSAEKILAVARKEGRQFVRSGIKRFVSQLQDAHKVTNKGPTKVSASSSPAPASSEEKKQKPVTASCGDTGEIKYKLEWRAPSGELFDALTNQGKVSAFTRSNAQVEAKEGGRFSLLGGGMSGTYLKVDATSDVKVIKQKWRLDTWPDGYHSDVSIEFSTEEEGVCQMKFEQTGVPYMELDRTKEGWKKNFWEPIKMIFGWGYHTK